MLVSSVPALAARPLLDKHQWDAYFALFARDVNVPWKPATVRLDTYSGAPVDFAAYNLDPAEVIVAGQNGAARAIDTSRLRPLVRWRFSPPPGYRFESSDVPVPLGSQEGFYVIEARRDDAVQQVWLNRTHVGLVTKEGPGGLVVWGVDLRSGRALANMKVSLLVGLRLIDKRTDQSGLIVWRDPARPSFALAEDGAGRAFVSILPQAPLPAAIVGLRVESAVARAGGPIRFVGFARKGGPAGYRRATGDARVTLFGHGTTLATSFVRLDDAGAFAGEVAIPAGVDAGDYAMLASTGGGVGGTTVHVDAASDVSLSIRSTCPCDPDADVPFYVVARRDAAPAPGAVVRVEIVRTPHVVPPGGVEDGPRWGTTVVFDRTLRTDTDGRVRVLIPSPSDGLDSTYGIRATTRGATATSRIVVPYGKISLALEPDEPSVDVGAPAAFDVRAFDPSDGTPVPGLAVKLRLSHGASALEQTVTLDARGHAHAVFRETSLGSNLALAEATAEGRRVLDAAAELVEPSALAGTTASAQGDVGVVTDKARYAPGDRVNVRASAAGASGAALFTLDGVRTYQTRLTSVAGGAASASLDLGDPQGAVRVWVAFVRDGAIATGSVSLNVDGPGHERATEITLDKQTYAEGDSAQVTIHDAGLGAAATLAVRIADGRESGPALFDDAPDVLAIGATSAQAPASDDPEWHAYVAPAHSKASDIFAAERPRKAPAELPTIGAAAPRTMFWRVARATGETFGITVPQERGHFVVSVLKIADDGDVGAASAAFNVQ
jgi:3-phenylpropionate/cinnamic acid dioxygenase small subunit